MLFRNDLEFQRKLIKLMIVTHGDRNAAYKAVCSIVKWCRFRLTDEYFKTTEPERLQELYEFWDSVKTMMDVDF